MLSSDICIHFVVEKEIEKIVILKKHAETLLSIFKGYNTETSACNIV